MFDDFVRDLLGFHAITIYEEFNLSANAVDILAFDSFFLECDIAQDMIFKGKRSGLFIILLWMLILVINILKSFKVVSNGI